MAENESERAEAADRRVQRTLSSIGRHTPAGLAPGPLADGLDPDTRLAIASFFDVNNARLYQQALSRAGIGSASHRQSRRTVIMVEYEDREVANQTLVEHLQHHPNHRLPGIRRDFDGLIFGIAIGLTIGLFFGWPLFPQFAGFAMIVPFVVLGVLLGHLYDRVRYHIRATGRMRIGVWEMLMVATLPAAIIFLMILIQRLL